MFDLRKWDLQYYFYCGLCLFFIVFLFNFTIHDGSQISLLYFLFAIATPLIIIKKKIILDYKIISLICIPFFCISLSEIILHQNNISDLKALWVVDLAKDFSSQFIYMIFIVFLPTIIIFTKFKTTDFFRILTCIIGISVLFNFYINVDLSFNRSLLIKKFAPIILYDYGMIALSLLVLCYGLFLKNKYSYFVILLSLINIFLIIQHGSRGAWLGLPIAFLVIFYLYGKDYLKKLIFISCSCTILLLATLFLIPNAPVQNRLQDFHHDKQKIVQQHDFNSSIGTRLSLWHFSFEKFKESPLLGVGFVQFREEVCQLHQQNKIGECTLHAHNVFLQILATQGIVGLFGILFLMLFPLAHFIKTIYNVSNHELRLLCSAGISFIVYLILCSLTDFYFLLQPQTMLFFLIVSSIIILIRKIKIDSQFA